MRRVTDKIKQTTQTTQNMLRCTGSMRAIKEKCMYQLVGVDNGAKYTDIIYSAVGKKLQGDLNVKPCEVRIDVW